MGPRSLFGGAHQVKLIWPWFRFRIVGIVNGKLVVCLWVQGLSTLPLSLSLPFVSVFVS